RRMRISVLIGLAVMLSGLGAATARARGCVPRGAFGIEASDGDADGLLHLRRDCRDHVGRFAAIPLDSHDGELEQAGGASTVSFTLPPGRVGEELRLTGVGGPPVVTIISPTGGSITTPDHAGLSVLTGTNMISMVA